MSLITSMPDVVIYFDVNTETALQRRQKRGSGMDVIEMKGVSYQEAVRESFKNHLRIAKEYHNIKIYTVDANQDIEGVQKQLDAILDKIANKGA